MRTDLLGGSAIALSQLKYATLISSQNINNADNPYYSRNIVVFGADPVGNLTASPQRMNNFFLTQQVHAANAGLGYSSQYLSFASSVDNIITGISPGDDGNSINPIIAGIDDIAESLSALATTDTTSGRESLLSRINSLLANVNTTQNGLDEFRHQINSELSSNATVLQNQAEQLAELNKQLAFTPNDHTLLTQRDTLLGEMSQLVDIDVREQENGGVSVAIAGGYPLVEGFHSSEIKAVEGPYGEDLYLSVNGDVLTDGERIGGALGGSVSAREELIDESERSLAKSLLGYFAALNVANSEGFTADGTAGGDLVTIPTVNGMASSQNVGTGTLSASIDPTGIEQLSAGPIEVEKTATGYTLTNSATGESMTSMTMPVQAFGYHFEAVGNLAVGDKVELDPMASMLKGAEMSAGVDDIAAAGSLPVTHGDTDNLRNLAAVTDEKIFNGGVDSIYDQLTNVFVDIGNNHVAAKQGVVTSQSISDTAAMRWANLSGVNTQEEELNMMKFQQIYQSVSKVIEADNLMFDSIISVL